MTGGDYLVVVVPSAVALGILGAIGYRMRRKKKTGP